MDEIEIVELDLYDTPVSPSRRAPLAAPPAPPAPPAPLASKQPRR